MIKYLMLAGVVLVGACGTYSPARIVIMQHPGTKQTAECKVDPWGHINRKLQIDSCVLSYEQAGYKKVGDSHPPQVALNPTIDLDGSWELVEVRAAGIHSGGAWDEAEALLGSKIRINGPNVYFPNGNKCRLSTPEQKSLKDDMESFGSGGGSHGDLGLIKSSNHIYEVIWIELGGTAPDCDEKFKGITAQPDYGRYLLGVWEVSLAMKKIQ